MQDDREDDALEPDDDQVVGEGEEVLVAAVVDVVADVPVHPEDRDQQRGGGHEHGHDEAGGHAALALRQAGDRRRDALEAPHEARERARRRCVLDGVRLRVQHHRRLP